MSETYENSRIPESTRVHERCEDAPCCGCCPSSQEAYDPYPDPEPQPYGGWEGSWAGDGSGLDDLADFNAMEGGDC